MARYGAVWLEIARRQYDSLPTEIQQQIDDRLEELLENPHLPKDAYDARTDQWIAGYGDGLGLILFTVVNEHQRVIVLRIV